MNKDKQAKLNFLWNKMSSSDQFSVDEVINTLEAENIKKENLTKDTLYDYVLRACNTISWGNDEPEYEDEDFYEEEPDERVVFEYLRLKYDLGED